MNYHNMINYNNCDKKCQYCFEKDCLKRKCPPKPRLVSEDIPYNPIEKDERKNFEKPWENSHQNLLFS